MSLNPERFPEQKRPLIEAILRCVNSTRFAKSIGVTRQIVQGWVHNSKLGVPAKYCKKIEEVTMGHITRQQLRPDIFGESENKDLPDKDKLNECIAILESIAQSMVKKKRGKK